MLDKVGDVMTDIFLTVKQSLDIITVAKDMGVVVNRHNKALSPFTNEKTPSFQLYPDTQSFYCFSTNQGGTVIDLVMKVHNTSALEAVKFLIDRYRLDVDISSGFDKSRYEEMQTQIELKASMKKYKDTTLNELSKCLRIYHNWQRDFAPHNSFDVPNQCFFIALQELDKVEYLYNELNLCEDKQIIDFFNKFNQEVKKYVKQCRTDVYSTNSATRGA